MAPSSSIAQTERTYVLRAVGKVRSGDAATSLTDRTDQELATLAQARDNEPAAGDQVRVDPVAAFEELVRRLEGPLFGFLTVRVGNAADAEELTQDAFLRAWTKLDRYDSRWRFSTWLFTIAKRLAVSRARVRRPDVLQDEVLANLPDENDPVESAANREESTNVWRLAAELLSGDQRSALWLRYAEGLSNQEIARILGKKRVTVRVLLFRARETLAKAIEESGQTAQGPIATTTNEVNG